MRVKDQEMDEYDEYKTPSSSRNNTQSMILEDDLFIMSQNSTQRTDQDMDEYGDETPFSSQNNTQQTDQGMIENYEEENNQEMDNESPPKKRKRTTKKKDETRDNETSTTINKKSRRAPTTTRKESTSKRKSKKKPASQTISSDTELPKELISETITSETSENQVKTKKSPAGRNFWSLEDDKKLIDAVLVNLQEVPWSKIARENFSNRDRSGCYNRWNVLKKRLYQDMNGSSGEK
ncbi:hypothetical protein C1646_662239 [Rhizophagus diaphanus]|nr:hypothetical protein C1646_662239 [Rhizophagus diaphanus] [Rhizophagus sp. MUCL 43196]